MYRKLYNYLDNFITNNEMDSFENLFTLEELSFFDMDYWIFFEMEYIIGDKTVKNK